ncbi:MAG: hypothetical protein ABI539_14090 [Acidobacteriota bacterium]
MKKFAVSILGLLFYSAAFGQSDLQIMRDSESQLERIAVEQGPNKAFLQFLADDAVIFCPHAVRGREFWKTNSAPVGFTITRVSTFADISSTGMLGYTTGNWRMYPLSRKEDQAKFGEYVTIWEKKPDGRFLASLDIETRHDKLPFYQTDTAVSADDESDLNKRSLSPSDASMDFFRLSMTKKALSGAYDKFAAKDIRFLREGLPPIIGKKNVVKVTKEYVSLDFPQTTALFQSGDMAYIWNKCSYDKTGEGNEEGNCLHIWKLRDDKWWIVLGVFAGVPNTTPPVLKTKPPKRKRAG